MTVAPMARERQVTCLVRTAMLFGNDVLNVVPESA